MIAAHVFMGAGYYPQSGLGDYEKSFYGDNAISDAEGYIWAHFKNSPHDWWHIVTDDGEGLREHSYGWEVRS